MFQFNELIEEGMESADKVAENCKNIDLVFEELNSALKEKTEGQITIERYVTKPGFFNDMLEAYQKAKGVGLGVLAEKVIQKGTLDISLSSDVHLAVARWEQHPDGYPFTIEFLGERIDCWDQESLATTLGRMVSSGQFWLKVRELQTSPQAEPEEKQKDNASN